MDIQDVDSSIKRLTRETTGLEGAVLRETNPDLYEKKQAELNTMTRAYFHFYFDPSVATAP